MENRKLIIPGVYKHFKHTEDGIPNNYFYCTKFVSYPKQLTNEEIRNSKTYLVVCHTESKDIIYLYLIDGKWYHSIKAEKKKLIVYVPLYDDSMNYGRPLEMFMSEVDHEKYPDINQKYRFEYVGGIQLKNWKNNKSIWQGKKRFN